MAAASPIPSSSLPPIIIDIRNILTTLLNLNFTTRLVWIPDHRGISGNEIVDSLAKSSITEGIPYDLLQSSESFTIEKSKYTATTNRSLLSASKRTGSIYISKFSIIPHQFRGFPILKNWQEAYRYLLPNTLESL